MPAPLRVRTRERVIALTAVVAVQLGLGVALLSGLRVDVLRPRELVSRLIEVTLAPVPPPPVAEPRPADRVERRRSTAPSATQALPGGSSPLRRTPAPETPTAVFIAKSASTAPPGGGGGTGPALGAGNGGGTGGQGGDAGEGGADLVQIAGAILPSDYPRALRERGIGGRVGMLFEVGPDGRVAGCSVTRSSGTPELDALTCRLIQQRFRYRPSTDRNGRPIADEVDGEHDWIAPRRQ